MGWCLEQFCFWDTYDAIEEKILLAVSGLTPQILTETLFALATDRENPFVPNEIVLITTKTGKVKALEHLFGKGKQFHQLCVEYGLKGIRFDEKSIHAVQSNTGDELDDIRTEQDHERVADTLTETIRRITENDDTSLHVSIAGGRKTMGYYAGYTLSLFGRPQDSLSHVLVSEPFEGLDNFYFPTRTSYPFEGRAGESLMRRMQ